VSARALRQLVGALAVVVLLGAVGMLLRSGSGSITATGAAEHVFDGIGSESLEGLRLERDGETTTLLRGDDGWTVDGFRADPDIVSAMLGVVDEATIGDLVATNPANHDRMGVSLDSAISATFTAGSEERTILIGKSGRRFGTAYVRLPGEDEVWLLEGDLRAQLSRGVDAWRDRAVVAVDTAVVARIVVEREGDGYALVRGDSTWTFDGGADANQPAVKAILSELARLMASGFVAAGDSLAAAPQAASTTALSADGAVLAEVRLGVGEGDRWARSTANETVYRVSSFRANRVAPDREQVTPGG
jgi:hypothetical protein